MPAQHCILSQKNLHFRDRQSSTGCTKTNAQVWVLKYSLD